ncbi:hypothetical protein MK805_06245 [Shimazuella sp. AN120528]|uniref:hypothetical protein n=1 Tax=Shimazuella soli TaxID=1892854 RepID=UPI001F0EBDDA|nr:hypothetical protein [Shimazuella soli]MCH5584569.1 hypothetical protein [Shimazuella soli]
MSILQTKRNLQFDWEKYWPDLSPLYLSFLELERDPYYSFLPEEELEDYLKKAIHIGEQTAKRYTDMNHLDFFNDVLKEDIRIRLLDQHPEQSTIRAQYHKKKQTIFIYKNSMREIGQFISKEIGDIPQIDIIALHAYHEWFHHLEETTIGRTDLKFRPVVIKQRGPFLVKRSLLRLREIAAHSFTQTALGLSWSPLLLDQFRYLLTKGYSNAQIRECFQDTKRTYYAIINKK